MRARSEGGRQRLDSAWVTGLQTRYHLSEATRERGFMVVRFTPLQLAVNDESWCQGC